MPNSDVTVGVGGAGHVDTDELPDGVPGLIEAVEAGAVVLAIVKCQGPDVWGRLGENERRIVMDACRGQARAVIEEAVPHLTAAVRAATLDEAAQWLDNHGQDALSATTAEGGWMLASTAVRDLRTEGQ